MRWRTLAEATVVSCMAMPMIACGGSAGSAVAPAPPTYAAAVGATNGSCRQVGALGAPLVVDWRPEQRGDLEVVMQEGIPAVHYDCTHLEVLDCSAVGVYGFLPVTRKEQVIQLETADEIRANLPLGGVRLAGEVESGAALDIALIMVGKRSTTVANVARRELRGRCDAATHFVRRATVGAFAMKVGTRGSIQSAADLFGVGAAAGSSSKKVVHNKDGQLSSCERATTSATAPPDQCGSLIRLELVAIDPGGELKNDPAGTERVGQQCPAGMVASEGKCTAPGSTPSFECDPHDEPGCTRQCDAGSTRSCVLLGRFVEGDARGPKDPVRAASLYERACNAGDLLGCTHLAFNLVGYKSSPERVKKSQALFEKACAGGEGEACNQLGKEYEGQFKGQLQLSLPTDPAKALSFYERSCNSGNSRGCDAIARLYDRGDPPVAKDPERALGYHLRACEAGNCVEVASIWEKKTDARYDKRVLAGFERACRTNSNFCLRAADLYERGVGASKDVPRAIAMYSVACSQNNGGGCSRLRELARTSGAAVLAAVRADCTAGLKWGCIELATLYEKGLAAAADPAGAREIYQRLCDPAAQPDIGNVGFVACDRMKKLPR